MLHRQGIARRDMVDEAAREYGGMVLRLAKSRIRPSGAVEDIFQEVFLSLYTSRTIFADEEHLKHWLVRATLNYCKNHHRYLRTHPEDPTDPLDSSSALSRESLAAVAYGSPDFDPDNELWERVRQLPESLSVVLVPYYAEGYTTAEIAAMLELNPITVRTRLAKARKKLGILLKGVDHGRE